MNQPDVELQRPPWVMSDSFMADIDGLAEDIAIHGANVFMVHMHAQPGPSGELDEYIAQPGFRQYTEHEDGGLETTPEARYLMAGIIGGPNIAATSGGVVVPIRHGIDLPMPSGNYRVRVENNYAADLFVVSRIHVVDGEERVEGQTETDFIGVGELVHRAGCYVNYDAEEWMNV